MSRAHRARRDVAKDLKGEEHRRAVRAMHEAAVRARARHVLAVPAPASAREDAFARINRHLDQLAAFKVGAPPLPVFRPDPVDVAAIDRVIDAVVQEAHRQRAVEERITAGLRRFAERAEATLRAAMRPSSSGDSL